jgi:nucleoside-diphosphate-sugar epimerase
VRVGITGATGFIGRRLLRHHVEGGDSVRAFSRHADPGVEWSRGAEWFTGDLSQPSGIPRGFVQGLDALYHCAAELWDLSRAEAVNVAGTQRLVDAAHGNIGRWVQLSSAGVYGRRMDGLVNEDTPEHPEGVYETTKASSDIVVRRAAEKGAFPPPVILRPTIVFGPDMPNQSVFQLVRLIDRGLFFFVGPPGASANYVEVSCVLEALTRCASDARAAGRTYILSDSRTIDSFAGAIASALGRPRPRLRLPKPVARTVAMAGSWIPGFPLTQSRVDAMTTRCWYDGERICRELDYSYPVTVEQGLQELVSAWKRG